MFGDQIATMPQLAAIDDDNSNKERQEGNEERVGEWLMQCLAGVPGKERRRNLKESEGGKMTKSLEC